MSFQEYPKMMVHPHHQPAIPNRIFPLGYRPQPGESETPGQPERLPPVTVNDENQQAMYEARGYFVQGSSGSVAGSEEQPAHYRYDEYPKWVRMHDDDVLVQSREEEHALLGYNPPSVVVIAEASPKKRGRPNGSKNKRPLSDKMAVND